MSKATGRNIFWFVMGGIYVGLMWYTSIGGGLTSNNFWQVAAGAIVSTIAVLIAMAVVVFGVIGIAELFEDDEGITKKNAKK